MSQVKAASARAHISVSKWLAQFAEAEKTKLSSDRQQFWQEIDRLRPSSAEEPLDFLLDPRQRDTGSRLSAKVNP